MLNYLFDIVSSFWPLILLAVTIVMAIALRKKKSFFYWEPRILSILFIIFMAWDSVSNEPTFGQKTNNFFENNIQTSIPLLIMLIIAWKYELVGGIGFLLVGLFYSYTFGAGDFPVAVPAFLIGILFIIDWLKKRKK